MGRNKKEDTGELMISIDQFTRTRDSVIVSLSNVQKGLAHVQNGLNDLMTAYIKHTASVLAGEDGAIESLQLPEDIAETANSAMAAATFAINNVAQAVAVPSNPAGQPKKRKRERKEKDPNAPKRPLTAAFLYTQAARPVVRKDLEAELGPGQKLEPNAVSIEVNKRWNEMSDADKEQWKASYRESLKKYHEEQAAYEASKGVAAVEELQMEEPISDEAEAGALDSDIDSESEDELVDEASPVAKASTPPPPANGKTPRANKRQKTAPTPQANGSVVPALIVPASSGLTPVAAPVPRQVTQVLPPSWSIDPPAPMATKKDKKKGKSAPQVPAAAPALGMESSPEEPRKKGKSSRSTRNVEAEAEAEAEAESVEKENKPAKKRDRSKRKSEAAAA